MALETVFVELDEKLRFLEQRLDDLLWAVVEGQPTAEQGHALVDYYDAATSDLIGLVKEAREAVVQSRRGTSGQLDLTSTLQALTICHDRFNRVLGRFYSEFISFEQVDALNDLVREKGGEWAKWGQGTKDALSQCPQPLHDVGQALFFCWQERAERTG